MPIATASCWRTPRTIPPRGTWIDKGMLKTDHTGIDGTVFELRGQLYLVYSA
jgi:GH43 family beta-xylosidase